MAATPISTMSNHKRLKSAALVAAVLVGGACSETSLRNPNAPEQGDYFTAITSRSQLQQAATGLLDGDRVTNGTQILFFETIGRDLVRIDPAESRYVTRLLGASLSNSDFIGNSIWNAPYRTIRGAGALIRAVDAGTIAEAPLTAQEKSAVKGFARTLQAMEYQRVWEARERNGIAIQTNSTAPVPLVCPAVALPYIAALYDSAATDLRAAGTIGSFPFILPGGFRGFTSPANFLKFNRGMAAKIAMYRGFEPNRIAADTADPTSATEDVAQLNRALALIDSSFYVEPTSRLQLATGVYHFYASGSGEQSNPLVDLNVFRVNQRVLIDSVRARKDTTIAGRDTTIFRLMFVTRAEPGDLRIQEKVDTASSNSRKTISGIGSRFLIRTPGAPSSPLAILTLEELTLMRAQINYGLGNYAEALRLMNIIRTLNGLPAKTALDFGGFVTATNRRDFLIAILTEKRFSLLAQSPSRMIDYRMHGIRLLLGVERNNAPIARFPIPNNEAAARLNQIPGQAGIPSCT